MHTAQFTAREITTFLRRRKLFIILPAIIVTIIAGAGAFLLERKYESSATILVQRDEITNPLYNYSMALSAANEDRLKTFNEIIYSETILQSLADSLEPGSRGLDETRRQALLKALRLSIRTERPGTESFRITFTDTDPRKAQRAAALIVRLFIEIKTKVENQQNELAVKFFEEKLNAMRKTFEASQREVVTNLRDRISDTPLEERALYAEIDELGQEIRDIDKRVDLLQRDLATLKTFPDALYTDRGRQAMYDLERADVPFVDDLRTLLERHDEFSQRYTEKYPDVERTKSQIVTLLERMRKGIENELPKQKKAQWDLQQQRAQLIDQLKRSSVTQRVDEAKESDYTVYSKLYDELKVKIEQARNARDLGRRANEQFIIIDRPLVPMQPSKPNRPMIVAGGLGCGLLLGFLAAIAAELLDSRIRTPLDIVVYQKPVIAFITEGHE